MPETSYVEYDYYEFQPIEGVPVMQKGDRFFPVDVPVEMGCNENKTIFWFVYQGSASGKKAKLTIDTAKKTETLEEVE